MTGTPDESCSIYFASKTLNNTSNFEQVINSSLSFGIGNDNMSFSINYDYHKFKQAVEDGYHKFIVSTADCFYYSTKLKMSRLPKFSQEMLVWLDKLNTSFSSFTPMSTSLLYEYFGTHFPTKVSYGASFTMIDKLTNSAFNPLEKNNENINALASLSSNQKFLNISLDQSTQAKVNNF